MPNIALNIGTRYADEDTSEIQYIISRGGHSIMRNKRLIAIGIIFGALLLGTASAYAVTAGTTVSVTVPPAIAITVPATHVLSATVGSQTTTNLGIGVKSNTTWDMTVYKDQNLTVGADVIPSARLLYTSSSTNGSGVGADTQFETSATPTNIVTGGTKTGEAGATATVSYKLTVNYDDNPGAYSAVHTYTATAP